MKKLVLMLVITVIWLSSLEVSFSQGFYNGTIYYIALHPGLAAPTDTVLQIYLFSSYEEEIVISKNSKKIRENISTSEYGFINFSLTASEAQSTTKYQYDLSSEKPIEKIFKNSAVSIKMKASINVSGVVRTNYGKQTDGFNLLNQSQLGKDYQVSNNSLSNSKENIPANYVSIVAAYDNTTIDFIMGGCLDCFVLLENGDTLKFDETIQRTLNENDVWLIPAAGSNSVLTGSQIKSDRPVAVFSGSNNAYNIGNNETNYTITQEIPTNNWNKQFLIPNFAELKDYAVINAFAKENETQIYVDDTPKWYIKNPGGIIDSGYIQTPCNSLSDEYPNPLPVEINSDKDINIMLINPGELNNGTKSQPIQMQIIPTEEFSTISFFKIHDIDFDNISIVFKATSDGNILKDLYISEILDGKTNWVMLSEYSPGNGSRFRNTLPDGTHWRSKNLKFEKPGSFSIRSNDPFAVYQYGFSESKSYGYPLMNTSPDMETPDTLAPYVEFTINSDCDAVGIVIEEPRNDSYIRSNLGLIYMENSDSYNYIFEFDEYNAGVDTSTNWRLKINNPAVNRKAHLVFMDRVGNRKDTIIECTPIVSVQENDLINSIEIRYDNGFLRFYSKEDYQIDEIEIFDLSGKLILNETINKTLNGYSLRTDNFILGVYIVKMYINGKWFSKKVII
ncbi:MAG: T9SS type A sorting domain-containing protein [Candidatus Kapabacteria bacterium]|nr:T9SS type A sorting domain-containing protein [Candidatus Kapabacteria bacterium]